MNPKKACLISYRWHSNSVWSCSQARQKSSCRCSMKSGPPWLLHGPHSLGNTLGPGATHRLHPPLSELCFSSRQQFGGNSARHVPGSEGKVPNGVHVRSYPTVNPVNRLTRPHPRNTLSYQLVHQNLQNWRSAKCKLINRDAQIQLVATFLLHGSLMSGTTYHLQSVFLLCQHLRNR